MSPRRNHYDLIVIGGGRSGYRAALCAKREGANTALIEKNQLGGHELSSGRTLIAHLHAHVASQTPGLNYQQACEWLQEYGKELEKNYAQENLDAAHIDTYFANATFAGTDRLEVGDAFLGFDKALIATGSSPIIPEIAGLKEINFITPHQLFEQPKAPEHIVFLGYTRLICEQAQICRSLGIKVSIVSLSPYLVPREVQETSRFLKELFAQQEIDLYLGASVHHVEEINAQIETHFDRGQGVESLQGDLLVVDWGTLSNHDNLDLEMAGIDFGRNGILVDDYLQTTNPNIFAAGEACTSFHIKQADDMMAYLAVRNALGKSRTKFTQHSLTRSILTQPEIAHVGLTVSEAQRRDYEVDIVQLPYAQENQGFAQIYVDRQSYGRLLGATLAGPLAREVIGHFALAIENKRTIAQLASNYLPGNSRSAVIGRLYQAFKQAHPEPGLKSLIPRLLGRIG